MSRYRANFHNVDMNADLLQFSYTGRWTGDPFNRWQDIFFPLRSWREKVYIEPDAARLVRTQGNEAFVRYVMYGATIANIINDAVLTYFGKHLSQFCSICDWGCGCARVIQAIHQIAPSANITGLDIDSDNIDWCEDSIKYATFATVPLFPPTQIPDGQFDLLYGISVLTRLTRKAFDAWCDELRRIVRPGGTILVTINRGAALVRTGHEGLITRAMHSGFDDAVVDKALDGKIADAEYYRSTYLSTSEAMRIFGTRFRVREILRQANGTSQDLVVCERPQ